MKKINIIILLLLLVGCSTKESTIAKEATKEVKQYLIYYDNDTNEEIGYFELGKISIDDSNDYKKYFNSSDISSDYLMEDSGVKNFYSLKDVEYELKDGCLYCYCYYLKLYSSQAVDGFLYFDSNRTLNAYYPELYLVEDSIMAFHSYNELKNYLKETYSTDSVLDEIQCDDFDLLNIYVNLSSNFGSGYYRDYICKVEFENFADYIQELRFGGYVLFDNILWLQDCGATIEPDSIYYMTYGVVYLGDEELYRINWYEEYISGRGYRDRVPCGEYELKFSICNRYSNESVYETSKHIVVNNDFFEF